MFFYKLKTACLLGFLGVWFATFPLSAFRQILAAVMPAISQHACSELVALNAFAMATHALHLASREILILNLWMTLDIANEVSRQFSELKKVSHLS